MKTLLTLVLLFAATAANAYDLYRRPRKKRDKTPTETVATPPAQAPQQPVAPAQENTKPAHTAAPRMEPARDLDPAQIDSLVAVWHERQKQDAYTEFFKQYILADSTASAGCPADSLYARRLRDLASPIQLPYNSIVQGYINRYTDSRYGTISRILGMSQYYFPLIEEELIREELPVELRALPIIESALSPVAVSPMGATGLWQFMPSTGKEYGLEVNADVDERYDVEKATEAACRYLRNAYARYGNWESVAASYNGGMGRITNELAAQQATSAYDLWLAEETMRYIFRLLSMKLIMENPEEYGYVLTADNLYQPLEYETVTVSGPVADWPKWAADHGTDYRTLREHNPWIRSKTLPNKTGKTYRVKIPTRDSMSRSKQKISVYNPAWVADR